MNNSSPGRRREHLGIAQAMQPMRRRVRKTHEPARRVAAASAPCDEKSFGRKEGASKNRRVWKRKCR